MKLAAIYNVWHDWDMLEYSIKHMHNLVDEIIIIGSSISNHGELSEIPKRYKKFVKVIEPDHLLNAMQNETMKRNVGLHLAFQGGHTHFLTMDADEFYPPNQFLKEKDRFLFEPDLQGLVCASRVYFKDPELTIGLDTTLVPFIHRLTPGLIHGMNSKYPFAFDKRSIRIDPTRQLNINTGVKWSNIVMDHYSWVRKDIEIKIRNSTARDNIEKSTIRQDFAVAKEGEMCNFYGKRLIRASNVYDLPKFDGISLENIKPVQATGSKGTYNE